MFMEHEASSVNSTRCLQRVLKSTHASSSCVDNSLLGSIISDPYLTTQAVSLSAIQGLPKADPRSH